MNDDGDNCVRLPSVTPPRARPIPRVPATSPLRPEVCVGVFVFAVDLHTLLRRKIAGPSHRIDPLGQVETVTHPFLHRHVALAAASQQVF